jgi:hypothetical protein
VELLGVSLSRWPCSKYKARIKGVAMNIHSSLPFEASGRKKEVLRYRYKVFLNIKLKLR